MLFCLGLVWGFLVGFWPIFPSDRDVVWGRKGFTQPLSSSVYLLLLESVLMSV